MMLLHHLLRKHLKVLKLLATQGLLTTDQLLSSHHPKSRLLKCPTLLRALWKLELLTSHASLVGVDLLKARLLGREEARLAGAHEET